MILVKSEANVKRLPRSNCQARMTGVSRLQHIDLAKPEIRMINNPIFWFEKMFQNIAKFQHENEVSSWDSHDAWWSNESWMDGSCVSLNRETTKNCQLRNFTCQTVCWHPKSFSAITDCRFGIAKLTLAFTEELDNFEYEIDFGKFSLPGCIVEKAIIRTATCVFARLLTLLAKSG